MTFHKAMLVLLLLAQAPAVDDTGVCLVHAAREQVGVTTIYDSSYQRLDYPGGDIHADRGVCTDVIVRAYRSLGLDLQVLVHEDMAGAFDQYPQHWDLSRPDRNIDHRRVPNLAVFFERRGEALAFGQLPEDYAPGDIVTWRLASGVPHIGIVSDRISEEGVPLVIHNIGRGTLEEDVLLEYTITGRYRYLPERAGTYPLNRCLEVEP